MQTSDNMSTPHDVHFDDTLVATRGRSNYYFSFDTWPIGVGTPRKHTVTLDAITLLPLNRMSWNCHWKSGRHITFQRTTSFTDGATKKIFMTKVSFILDRTLYISIFLAVKKYSKYQFHLCLTVNDLLYWF